MPRRKTDERSRSRRGDGSVYQRKDGKWVGEAVVGRRADGARLRRYVYGNTREEVQAELRKLLYERDRGLLTDPGKQTVGDFLRAWLRDVAKPSVRQRTYERYELIIRRHLLPGIGSILLSKLTPQHVQNLYRRMMEAGLTSTTRQAHAILHKSLGQAAKWGLVPRNVADLVDPPKTAKKEFRVLTPEEAQRFLDAAEGDRFYALYVLAVMCGLREGELLGLKWEDVDLDRGVLQVKRQLQWVKAEEGKDIDGKKRRTPTKWVLTEPKSAKSRRVVTLPALAVAALKKHKACQTEERLRLGEAWQDLGLVFTTEAGTPVHKSNLFNRSFKPLLERAGLPKLRFHDLRHTCATILLARGIHPKLVQEQLGHSQISLTLDTYSHVLPALQKECAATMDGVFGTKKAR